METLISIQEDIGFYVDFLFVTNALFYPSTITPVFFVQFSFLAITSAHDFCNCAYNNSLGGNSVK